MHCIPIITLIIFSILWTTPVTAFTPTVELLGYNPFNELPLDKEREPECVQKGNTYIPKGFRFKVILLENIDSKNSQERQLVKMAAAEDVKLNGITIIPKGQPGTCFILKSRKAGGFGRKGKLWIAGNEITTSNGIPVALCHGLGAKGKTDPGAAAVAAIVSSVGGFLMKGSNVHHPIGKIFFVSVREDTDLGCTFADLPKTMLNQSAKKSK